MSTQPQTCAMGILANRLFGLTCREFIAIVPLFLPMAYFSVFSAFSVAISSVPLCLCAYESITQNKPNSQNPKTNANLATAKNYEQKPPPPHSKKQTQSNPIPPRRDEIRNTTYDIPHAKQQAPSVSLSHRGAGVFPHNSPMDTLTKSSYNAP